MPDDTRSFIQINSGVGFARHREFRIASEFTRELVPGEPETPDLAVLPRRPMDLRHPVIRGTKPPLPAVEIVSPGQGMQEILEKVEFHLAHGVKCVGVVLPPWRQITVFPPDGNHQHTHRKGVVRDPATGITADLDAVFA